MSANPLPIAAGDSAYRLVAGQQVLNRYTIQRLLGRGGMGVVWLAKDDALELDVALKFIPSLVVNDRASLEDLKRETRRNLALTHPNIVRTYDFVQGGTLAGISMEYVDSNTLRDRRVDQPSGVFAPEDLGEWTLQLTDALHYAHQSASIVHRDLKPANLLINGRNQLKVADFGIARSLGESVTQVTGRNTSMGTMSYMSPQQLDGDPADPLDDIYAVGATLYELCTSRPPFYSGDLSRQIFLKTASTMAERRAELGIAAGTLPTNWEATIAACLAKERTERPQSAREIAVRLGLKEAASVRTSKKPLPLVHKVAVTPLKPPTPTAPVPASLPDWKTRSLDTVRRGSRAALAVAEAGVEKAKSDRRAALAAVAAVIVAVTVAALWLRGSHGGGAAQGSAAAAASAKATAARGGVSFETEPAGALVRVDDRPAEKAPLVIRDLATGSHAVSVQMEGYEDYTANVAIKANQVTEPGKINLVPLSGRLNVTTNPPGAEIVVHGPAAVGLEMHYTSPWESGKLPVGDYEVTATRPGWEPAVQKVSLARDQSVPVKFDLLGGTVQINSVPPKATVLLEGKPVGVTPFVAEDVPPGAIKYSVSLLGFSPADVEGKVEPGQTLTLETKLVNVAEAAKPGRSADEAPPSSASRRSANEEEEHHHRSSSSSKKSGGSNGSNDFLNRLKRLPIPFWRH